MGGVVAHVQLSDRLFFDERVGIHAQVANTLQAEEALRCVRTDGFRALEASKRLLVLLWLWKRDVRRFKRFSCVTGSMEKGSHAALDARCERQKLW